MQISYLYPILAFSAALIGVLGDTRHKDTSGWRKITWVGYVALVLAAIGCALSTHDAILAERTKSLKRQDAIDFLGNWANTVYLSVERSQRYSQCAGQSKANEKLEQALHNAGHGMVAILAAYGNDLPEDARKLALKLQVLTYDSERLKQESTDMSYLSSLDSELRNMLQAVGYRGLFAGQNSSSSTHKQEGTKPSTDFDQEIKKLQDKRGDESLPIIPLRPFSSGLNNLSSFNYSVRTANRAAIIEPTKEKNGGITFGPQSESAPCNY